MYNVDSDECEADCENPGQCQRALRVDDYVSSNYMNNVVHDLEESQWDVSESRPYHLDSEAWNANDNIETPLAANMYRNNALDFENQQQEPKMQSTVLLLFINPPNSDNKPTANPLNYARQPEAFNGNSRPDRASYPERRPSGEVRSTSSQMENDPFAVTCLCQDDSDQWYEAEPNTVQCQCKPATGYDSDSDDLDEKWQLSLAKYRENEEAGASKTKSSQRAKNSKRGDQKTFGKAATTSRKAMGRKGTASQKAMGSAAATNKKATSKKTNDRKYAFYNRFSPPPFVIEPKPRCCCGQRPMCWNHCGCCCQY
ncbi:uncharacterized protein LOC111602538 isoform X2 [Drosophila hydei]|uniref:Uncharacterized protein LOC111602538 isoform X2 n=1 Tax=Drosophila hydei TaxID=7224 RepID=A0A6J1M5W4_DROHY|nr:uncharacterized protein LOC111602538 isoform X2 [Drosophila hydei]